MPHTDNKVFMLPTDDNPDNDLFMGGVRCGKYGATKALP